MSARYAQPTGEEDLAIVGRHLTKAYGLSERKAAKALEASDPAAAVALEGGFLGATTSADATDHMSRFGAAVPSTF